MQSKNKGYWVYWGVFTLLVAAFFSYGLLVPQSANQPVMKEARKLLLPGATTHGHHTIEMSCETCHTSAFGGPQILQNACVKCHAAELELADDSHPATKFDSPSNVHRLEKLNAQQCVTCHAEHNPHITGKMGVTLPKDYCFHCHAGEDEMPPSHKDLAFDTCMSCHSFHDNRALYEDFLVKHGQEEWLFENGEVPAKGFAEAALEMMTYPLQSYPLKALTLEQNDAPKTLKIESSVHQEWLASKHAQNGVNCTACHVQTIDEKGEKLAKEFQKWDDHPNQNSCRSCHTPEVEGFLSGKHGVSLKVGLGPMTPAKARLPMKQDAMHKTLSCTTCHGAHKQDMHAAAMKVCLSCHDDGHSKAYLDSPHHKLWQAEIAGEKPAGTGVSCATCHMPRVDMDLGESSRIVVQHNQNDTLRPNVKMLRPVCMSCHALGFGIDALGDEKLIRNNFNGKPTQHNETIEMALKKEEEAKAKRAAAGLSDSMEEDDPFADSEEEYEEDFDEYN